MDKYLPKRLITKDDICAICGKPAQVLQNDLPICAPHAVEFAKDQKAGVKWGLTRAGKILSMKGTRKIKLTKKRRR